MSADFSWNPIQKDWCLYRWWLVYRGNCTTGLFYWDPALPVVICGVWKLQEVKLLVAAVWLKQTKEGAGVKTVMMNEYGFGLMSVVKQWLLVRAIWLGQWLEPAELREAVSRRCFSESTPWLPLLAFCRGCSLGGYRRALLVAAAVGYQQMQDTHMSIATGWVLSKPLCLSCPSVSQELSFLFPWTALCRLWRESCSISRAGGRQSEAARVKCSICILLILTYWFQWDEVSVKEKWDCQADRSSGIRGRLALPDKSKIV